MGWVMRMTAVSCYSTLDISANCINGTHPESSIASCEAVHGLQPSFPSLHLQHIEIIDIIKSLEQPNSSFPKWLDICETNEYSY